MLQAHVYLSNINEMKTGSSLREHDLSLGCYQAMWTLREILAASVYVRADILERECTTPAGSFSANLDQ